MKKTKQKYSVNRIEIDGNSEPKIVEVTDSEIADQQQNELNNENSKNNDKVPEKKNSAGKQLAMSLIFGINEEDIFINRRQKVFKRIFTAVFIVFVVGVLAWTFYRDFFSGQGGDAITSFSELINIFSKTWYFLIFAILSLGFCYFFKGLKLSVVCHSMTKKFHFKTCMETGIIGYYYNNITPLAVGGQPFEIYHLSKHGVHGGVASSMPIITFFLNQFAFVAMGIVSLILFKHNTLNLPEEFTSLFPEVIYVMAIIGLVCCLFMPTLVVTFSLLPRVGAKLVHFIIFLGAKLKIVKNPEKTNYKTLKTVIHNSRCIKKFSKTPVSFFLTILLSVAEWAATCSIAYFTLRFFGFDLTNVNGITEWAQITQMCLILYAAISFIPTPGNSGAADLSFYALFQVKLMAGLAFSAMVVWRILSFYSFIIIGFIFTTLKKKSDAKHQPLYEEI